MGRIITLICDETPGLKLGPGVGVGYIEDSDPPRRDVIVFGAGFAQFDEDLYPEWETWARAKGTPHIEIVEDESGQIPAAFGLGYDCLNCAAEGKNKSFVTQAQLNGHRLMHLRKAKAEAVAAQA